MTERADAGSWRGQEGMLGAAAWGWKESRVQPKGADDEETASSLQKPVDRSLRLEPLGEQQQKLSQNNDISGISSHLANWPDRWRSSHIIANLSVPPLSYALLGWFHIEILSLYLVPILPALSKCCLCTTDECLAPVTPVSLLSGDASDTARLWRQYHCSLVTPVTLLSGDANITALWWRQWHCSPVTPVSLLSGDTSDTARLWRQCHCSLVTPVSLLWWRQCHCSLVTPVTLLACDASVTALWWRQWHCSPVTPVSLLSGDANITALWWRQCHCSPVSLLSIPVSNSTPERELKNRSDCYGPRQKWIVAHFIFQRCFFVMTWEYRAERRSKQVDQSSRRPCLVTKRLPLDHPT